MLGSCAPVRRLAEQMACYLVYFCAWSRRFRLHRISRHLFNIVLHSSSWPVPEATRPVPHLQSWVAPAAARGLVVAPHLGGLPETGSGPA